MKIDTEQKLADLTFSDLKELESQTKGFLVKINRAKRKLEKAEAKKNVQEALKAARTALKEKEQDLKDALTKMGYTKEQIKQAVSAMLQTAIKPVQKAKRNRGPAKYIHTHPKTKEIYTAGKPPKWYQDMTSQERARIRKNNPARTKWEKEQA